MVYIRENMVEFLFYRPGAREVYLAGDFNEWNVGSRPMIPLGHGYWGAQCILPPGEFHFRYYADGQWYTDYAANGVEPSEVGLDSILTLRA